MNRTIYLWWYRLLKMLHIYPQPKNFRAQKGRENFLSEYFLTIGLHRSSLGGGLYIQDSL